MLTCATIMNILFPNSLHIVDCMSMNPGVIKELASAVEGGRRVDSDQIS